MLRSAVALRKSPDLLVGPFGDEMSEPEANSKIKTDIPFLFYDVIGRMMPGAYLIFGIAVCSFPFFTRQQFICLGRRVQAHTPESAIAVSIIGICIVFFFCASAFCGFLLASLSYLLVEKPWNRCSPLNYKGMKEFMGEETAASINSRFDGRFGVKLEKLDSLNRPSFICAYDIWRTDINLGQMQGRHDADLLAAQSFVLVTMVLVIITGYEACVYLQPFLYSWLAILIILGLGSVLSFNYHRKKRVYGRFEMFLALNEQASPIPVTATSTQTNGAHPVSP